MKWRITVEEARPAPSAAVGVPGTAQFLAPTGTHRFSVRALELDLMSRVLELPTTASAGVK